MKKRIFAMICLMTVLLTTIALGFKTDAESNRYMVGYAIKVECWIIPTDRQR